MPPVTHGFVFCRSQKLLGSTVTLLLAAATSVTAFQSSWTRPVQQLTVRRPLRRNAVMPPAMVATDEAGLMTGPGGAGGMFTSSDPEDRRVRPEDPANRAQFKVVYVVLESQYQASMTAAAKRINAGQNGVCVEVVGYLLEELRDEGNYKRFQEDLQDANIFIGSLIFVQELAEKVRVADPPPAHERTVPRVTSHASGSLNLLLFSLPYGRRSRLPSLLCARRWMPL